MQKISNRGGGDPLSFKSAVYDFSKYNCEISHIIQAYKENNIQFFINFWEEKSNFPYFELKHPLYNNIITRAIFNTYINGANFVFMIDKSNEYCWIFAQSQSLIDVIMVEDYIFHISRVSSTNVFPVVNKLGDINLNEIYFKDIQFDFSLSQSRPYHYFFDQLRYFYSIKNPKTVFKDSSFFIPSNVIFSNNENMVHLSPSGIAGNQASDFSPWTKDTKPYDIDLKMYKNVIKDSLNNSSKSCKKDKAEIILWLGLCIEHRYWIEQVDGYSNIIKELSKYYSSIKIYFDGLTARDGQFLKAEQDENIYDSIKNKLKNIKNLKLISLIGTDYKRKISECYLNVDFFICEATTSSLVPRGICQKKGVIFTNSNYYRLFKKISSDKIKLLSSNVIESVCGQDAMWQCIHTSWQNLFNDLVDIIDNKNIQKIQPDPIEKTILSWIFEEIVSICDDNWQERILKISSIFAMGNKFEIAISLLKNIIKYSNDKEQELIKKIEFYNKFITPSEENISLKTSLDEALNTINSLPILKQKQELANLKLDESIKKLEVKKLEKDLGLKLSKLEPRIVLNLNESLKTSAVARIKNHLTYKLGTAIIICNKSLFTLFSLPFILSFIKAQYKKEQNAYKALIKKRPELKLPNIETYPDYKEALKEKECFTYKLGLALMKADKEWLRGGYIKFYFEAKKLEREFKKNKGE